MSYVLLRVDSVQRLQDYARRMSLLMPSDQSPCWLQAVSFRDLSCTDTPICQVSTFCALAAAACLVKSPRHHSFNCIALTTVHPASALTLYFALRPCTQAP